MKSPYLRRRRNTQKVHKPNVFVPHNFHLVNQAKPTEIIPKLLLGHILIQSADVHISHTFHYGRLHEQTVYEDGTRC